MVSAAAPLFRTVSASGLVWRSYAEAWWRFEPERWDRWVTASRLPLFLRRDWMDTVLRHGLGVPRVWVAFAAGEPVGALPLSAGRWRGIPLRTFFGAGPLCPDHLDLVTTPEWAEVLWQGILTELLPRLEVPLVRLEGLRQSSLLSKVLPRTVDYLEGGELLGDASKEVWLRRRLVCPRLLLTYVGTEGLLAGVSPKLRKEWCYLQRRLRRDAPELGLRPLGSKAEQEAAIAKLAEWSRGKFGTDSVWNDPRFVAFHRDWSRQTLRRGEVCWYALTEGSGEPWALAYVLPDGTTLRYYQPGLDRRLARYSPGKLLLGSLIELAPARGWRELDLMRGEEAYKFEWNPKITSDGDWWLATGKLGRVLLGWARRWKKYRERAEA